MQSQIPGEIGVPNRKGIWSPSSQPFIEIHGSGKYHNKYKESGNLVVPQDHRSLRCKQVGAIESKSFKGNLITFSIEESLSEEIVLMRYILIFKKPCPLREFYIKLILISSNINLVK